MAKRAILILFLLSLISYPSFAAILNTPTLSVSDGSVDVGSAFTSTGSVTCTGQAECRSVVLTINLPSGLSTSSPSQSCGHVNGGQSCTKTWTVNADSAGTHVITLTASAQNADTVTSSSVSVTATAPQSPDGESGTPDGSATPDEPPETPVSVTILNIQEGQLFRRGETVLVRASLGEQTSVRAYVNDVSVNLYDDGAHGDDKPNDKIYANNITLLTSPGSTQLKVRVIEEGKTGTASANIEIDSSLRIVPIIKNEYQKGAYMEIGGTVVDINNKVVPNASIDITLFAPGIEENLTAISGSNGSFSQRYYVNFLDPDGTWTIDISAYDKFDNLGNITTSANVKTPPEAAYYYLKFNSPLTGLTYSRGDKIPISVELLENDQPVSDANVSVKTPSGSIVTLIEVETGTYSSEYLIEFEEDFANYTLNAFGYKLVNNSIRGGANKITLTVNPAKLTIDLISPVKTTFTVGETVQISAKVLYPDGTAARNLLINASTQTQSILLSEIEPGTYRASYKVKPGEEGQWVLQLAASDESRNSGTYTQVVQVSPITLFYILLTYWYLTLLGLAPIAYAGYRGGRKMYLRNLAKRYTAEIDYLEDMKKDAQINYFKHGSIDRRSYDGIIEQYRTRKEKVISELAKVKRKLEG